MIGESKLEKCSKNNNDPKIKKKLALNVQKRIRRPLNDEIKQTTQKPSWKK